MIKILFFGQLREQLDTEQMNLDGFPGSTVADLKDALVQMGSDWQQKFSGASLLAAVNQTIVDEQASVRDGDEVAFFPPVTGG